jgi:integrase
VRRHMIDSGLCRKVINQRIGKIVRVFRWATENELVPATTYQALKAVSGLRKGRSAARESEPVKPVPESHIVAIQPHVVPQVWAMIQLQLLSGMRPGEVTVMRTCDLDISSRTWVYSPERHKTEHLGRERRIYLGPRAQAVLESWIKKEATAYLFSPREAMESRWAERRCGRRSPMTPSQRARRRKATPARTPGTCYDTRSYAHAIHRACRRAGVPVWGPNRLRHNAATRLRSELGLETARAVLGHSDARVTTIYTERDWGLAQSAMEHCG